MKIYVIATPIGNLDDLSPRAIETLKNCDLIAAEDTRVTLKLLNHFDIRKPLTSYHKFNELNKSKELVQQIIENNLSLALVSDCGTPCISDPGAILLNEAIQNNIEICAIPGPSAIIAGLSASGFVLNSFTFYGFLPRKNKELNEKLTIMKEHSEIAIAYESPNRIKNLVCAILDADARAELCLCRELSKIHETYYRGTPLEVLQIFEKSSNYVKGEYCVIIKWSEKVDNSATQSSISLESRAFDLLYQNYNKKDIIEKMVGEGYKKNAVYSALLNIENFINNFKKSI